jgi:hypothetical protein
VENSYYIIGKSTNFHVFLLIFYYRLCLTVLRYKGQQVEKQREEIEMLGKDSSLTKIVNRVGSNHLFLSHIQSRCCFKASRLYKLHI